MDDNHNEIVDGLRQVGCKVLSLAAVGRGCPDILVYRVGKLILMEIKDEKKPPSKRKLTPLQVEFHKHWPVHIVTNLTEALAAVGLVQV